MKKHGAARACILLLVTGQTAANAIIHNRLKQNTGVQAERKEAVMLELLELCNLLCCIVFLDKITRLRS